MTLTLHLRGHFTRQVQESGDELLERGAIKVLSGSSESQAEVWVEDGGEEELVHIELGADGRLVAVCSCTASSACAHVWAGLRELEGQSFWSHAPRRLVMITSMEDVAKSESGWRSLLDAASRSERDLWSRVAARETRLIYVIRLDNPTRSVRSAGPMLEVRCRQRMATGQFGKIKALTIDSAEVLRHQDTEDRGILGALLGLPSGGDEEASFNRLKDGFRIEGDLCEALFPQLAATGRLFLEQGGELGETALVFDEGGPWELCVRVRRLEDGDSEVSAQWVRDEETLELDAFEALLPEGFLLSDERVARFAKETAGLAAEFRRTGPVRLARRDEDAFLKDLLESPAEIRLEAPEDWTLEVRTDAPQGVFEATPRRGDESWIGGRLRFDYGDGRLVDSAAPSASVGDAESRRYVARDREFELAKAREVLDMGALPETRRGATTDVRVPAHGFVDFVRALIERGFRVYADGSSYRAPGQFQLWTVSDIDWFDVKGSVSFGDQEVPFPRVLAAIGRGEKSLRLEDGSTGVLPDRWLSRFWPLLAMGQDREEALRFRVEQAWVLDALVEDASRIEVDEKLREARERLAHFDGIGSIKEEGSFEGHLRDYQRDGLGWLEFLRRFEFGGCLADDMGLGKTIQVLAMVDRLRCHGDLKGPCLVVTPRSVAFNWLEEARRFTPELEVLDYTGAQRESLIERFEKAHIVVTTYGLMRRDIMRLQDVDFFYVILDESQAIKNAGSQSAKAARLLCGRHRLALTGTPIENSVSELWSLMDFLNPGMLGGARVFRELGKTTQMDVEGRRVLANAVRPFILRRTKEQVVQELPDKTESIIYCDLDPDQRKDYDGIREYYRASVLAEVDRRGISKSKMHILEALLRLRQMACHPGLIDSERREEDSAKLEVILLHIEELLAEDHKALVFSQFTSLLRIVAERLDRSGFEYEYMDGQTRDRDKRVKTFQEDPDCKLFLVSIRAGGIGLNLTAADYVFILDPWWNPAVEAQAIDRAYRIGQTKNVFAYRLIARDTVEEKIVALQRQKKDLAEAIIHPDNSPMGSLTREDLEALLS